MPSTRPLSVTTSKGQTLGFHPGNHDSILKRAPATKKSSSVVAPTRGGYYYNSHTSRLTGTRARSRQEHIPQANSEQLHVKQSLHRIQDPASTTCRSSNHTMAFSACVDPLEILKRTCPKLSTKTELLLYPGEAGCADITGVHDQPLSSQGIQRAPDTSPCLPSKEMFGTHQWLDQRGLITGRTGPSREDHESHRLAIVLGDMRSRRQPAPSSMDGQYRPAPVAVASLDQRPDLQTDVRRDKLEGW